MNKMREQDDEPKALAKKVEGLDTVNVDNEEASKSPNSSGIAEVEHNSLEDTTQDAEEIDDGGWLCL